MTSDTTATDRPRVLSGITPSGPLTLGNYLGALRRFVDGQERSEGFFFVADLHAMTTEHDPARLQELTLQTAALFLAAGSTPNGRPCSSSPTCPLTSSWPTCSSARRTSESLAG